MEATPPPQQPGPGYGSQWPAPAQNQPPGPPGYGQQHYPQGPSGGGKLDTSGTFERIFQLYGSQFTVFVGVALIVFLPVAALQAIAVGEGSLTVLFLSLPLSILGNMLLTGAVVQGVSDMRDGRRDLGIGGLFKAAAPFIVPLLLGSIVFAIGAMLSLIAFIVGIFVFITWFCLFAPSIVVERQGVFGSLQRSRDLVRGNAWRVFGVIAVVGIIGSLVSNLIARIAQGVSDDFAGVLVGSLIGSVLTAPLWALGVSVLYFQLRDLKEGTQGLSSPAPPPQL